MKRLIGILVGLELVLSIVVGNAWGGVEYSFTDLGTFGSGESRATGINNSGQVVGHVFDSSGIRAFLYPNGPWWDDYKYELDPYPQWPLDGRGCFAYGINDSGQVVGQAYTTGQQAIHAYLFNPPTCYGYVPPPPLIDLGTFGGTVSGANGINASGQVVGWAYTTGNYNVRAFLYSGSTMTDLGTLGGTGSWANGINDSGQVVGWSNTNGPYGEHAFLYSGSTMTDLGTLGGGGTLSEAYGINATGQVVGWANTFDVRHAFLYSGSTMTDLGTLGGTDSFAYGINAYGQVVGSSYVSGQMPYPDPGIHAFIYKDGVMKDLNTLINPPDLWPVLVEARAINDAGQIVGYCYDYPIATSQQHAFLLTPLPLEIRWIRNDGSWDSASNWNLGTSPQLGNKAMFENSTGGTITLDGNRIVSALQFNTTSGGYTISPGSVPSSKLVIQSRGKWAANIVVSSGSHTIAAPLEMKNDLTIIFTTPGATLTINQISDLDGSKNLTVIGNGDLTVGSAQVGALTIEQTGVAGGYNLSGSGQLSTYSEDIDIGGKLTQAGGTNTSTYIKIVGTYTLSGGILNINGGFENKHGVWDLSNSSAVINLSSTCLNLSGTILTTSQNTTLNIDAHSCLWVPSGHNASEYFATINNSGQIIEAGTTLTISSADSIQGTGSIDDHVNCEGTLSATSGYLLNLNSGLSVLHMGSVDLGGGNLYVNDAISGISAGTLNAYCQYVGSAGTGTFTQTGGTNVLINSLYVGDNSGSTGMYNLNGTGQLSAYSEYVGNSGTGTFTQTGGTNTITYGLALGYNSDSIGMYSLDGTGQLSAYCEYVGISGSGTFTQTGGTNASSSLYLGYNSGSSGTYNLNGGILDIEQGSITISNGGTLNARGGMLENVGQIQNDGAFNILEGIKEVGVISGSGTTQVDSGASLTAQSINQATLTVGPGATVTIAPIPGGPLANTSTPVPEPSTLVFLSAAIFAAIYAWVKKRIG